MYKPTNISSVGNSFVFLVFLPVLISGCRSEHVNKGAIQKEVELAFDQLIMDAKTLEVETYLRHFHQEFTGMNHDGTIIVSKDAFREIYASGIQGLDSYISLDFPTVKIRVLNSNTAILINEYVAKVKLKSGQTFTGSGSGTQVWIKREQVWQLISVSSALKPNQ